MRAAIHRLCNCIFPKRRSAEITAGCDQATLLKLYRPHSVGTATALLPYQNELVQALITEAKFHHNKTAQRLLATVLTYHFQQHSLPHTCVAVPLSKQRQRARGHNQITSILTHCDNPNIKPIMALRRVRDTPPQTSLSRAERLQNMSAAFQLSDTVVLPTAVTLIDDVVTTGATLAAAAAPLQHAGVSVTLIALSH